MPKSLVLESKIGVVLLSTLEECSLRKSSVIRARLKFLSTMLLSVPKRAVGVLGPPMSKFLFRTLGRSRLSWPCWTVVGDGLVGGEIGCFYLCLSGPEKISRADSQSIVNPKKRELSMNRELLSYLFF